MNLALARKVSPKLIGGTTTTLASHLHEQLVGARPT